MEKECSIIINDNGMTIVSGDIRIQGIEDIFLKKSATDVGQSLKAYIASKDAGVETIYTSNIAKLVNEENIENNSDTVNEENK